MISVKEFIKDTLSQINEATKEFNQEIGESGAASVAPEIAGSIIGTTDMQKNFTTTGLVHLGYVPSEGTRFESRGKSNVSYATMVEFDVAVTATDAESANAGAKVTVVSVFKAGGEIETQTINTSVSRVSFKLPLRLV